MLTGVDRGTTSWALCSTLLGWFPASGGAEGAAKVKPDVADSAVVLEHPIVRLILR